MPTGTNVGGIWYEVTADTQKLLDSVTPVDKSLGKLNSTFNKTDKAANQANFRMTKTAAAVKNIGKESSTASAHMSALSGVLKGLITIQTARMILSTADAWTTLQNRLRLVTDGQRELAQATDDVFRIAQETSQEVDSVAQVYQRFAQNADRLGLSQKDLAEITDTVAKAVAVSGVEASSAAAALRQLGQAVGAGALRGDELNSILENTPALAQAIATGLGVTIGQLRTLGAEGKLTGEALIGALKAAQESVGEQFSTRVKTAGQAWTELRNSVARFIGEANESAALTRSLADSIEDVSRAIDNADVDGFARELEGLKATVALIMDGVDAMMQGTANGADSLTSKINTSFSKMALSTAKEVDGIAKVFQGTAGAVGAVWEALADNIPTYFSNAWSEIKSSAASFVNDLADLINKPIQALGGQGIGHVDFDPAPIRAIVSLTEAAADGWEQAAKGVGAYDRTLKRVTDNAIQSSIAEWQSEYTEETKKATAATNDQANAIGKLSAAQKEQIKAGEANNKVIDDLAAALMMAGLSGKDLALAKAESRLNVFATPEEVQAVRALAAAMYEVQQAEADRQLINSVDPVAAEQERYESQVEAFQDMLERKKISQEEFNAYMAELQRQHDETMGKLTEENWELGAELETARYETELEALTTALMNEELAYADYYARLEALNGSHAAKMQKLDSAKNSAMLKSGSDLFAALLSASQGFVGEQTGVYKALFSISKAFALAQAAIKIQQGIAEAWSLPFPANLAAVAKVVAGTAPILANINSVSFAGGRQHGGPVNAEKMYRINETGAPEILNLANGRQYMLPNARGEVVSNRDATAQAAQAQSGGGPAQIIRPEITVALNGSWFSASDIRRLVGDINDAITDGMTIRVKN